MDWIGALGAGAASPAFRRKKPAGRRMAADARAARGARGSPQGRHRKARQARAGRIEPPAKRRGREERTRASASSRSRCSTSAAATALPPLSLLDDPKPQPKGYSRRDAGNPVAADRIQAQGFPHRGAGGRRLSRPGDHPLRAGAGAGRQGQPDFLARQGHRPRPVGEVGARGRRDSGQVGGRPGNPEHATAR